MQLPLAPVAPTAVTVSELTRRIRENLDAEFAEVWVVGEISNFRAPTSGHFYFSLKDARCQIAAVMFRGANAGLSYRPADGMEVVAHGRVSLYDVRGALQLYVDWMEPRGVGAMQLALEQLKRRLAEEGLFDSNRKRTLPALPRTVGLVTALTGAAVQDMLAVLRRRWPAARVVISPVRVQGKDAGADIVAALAAIGTVDGVDVVIVGRGGGSIEDLWAFNEERVVRAIAACAVPVVSAVGHATDVTLADMVADHRAATPTAAAAMVVPDGAAVKERLLRIEATLRLAVERRLGQAEEKLRILERRLRDPRRVLETLRQRVDELNERLAHAAGQRILWFGQRLRAAEERLGALSPLAVLDRGYSIVRRDDGAVIRSAGEVQIGDRVRILLAAGRLRARVEERET